jgi:para-nitrobenzyl esterase
MSGGTRDEHRLFSVMREAQSPLTEEAYSQSMRDAFGEAAAARVLEHYPVGDQPPILAWAAVASDRSWACPTQWGNELIAARTTVFAYDFADRNAPTGGLDRGAAFPLGAAHFFEVPYLLDTRGEAGEPWPAPQQALADLMIQYWSNFARTGDPNGAGLPRWEAFDPQAATPFVMNLEPGRLGGVDHDARHQCLFWGSLVEASPH